jgi:membrane protein required for colicin V production
MNILSSMDIIFIILMLLLSLRCTLRGLIGELIPMASIILGLMGSIFFFKNGADFIRTKVFTEMTLLPEIIAFLGIFLVVFFAGKWLENMLMDIIQRIHLVGVNHFLGAIFGFIEGITLVTLIIFILGIQPLFNALPLLENSFFARLLLPLIGIVQESPFFAPGTS